jgi:hypothetical protein
MSFPNSRFLAEKDVFSFCLGATFYCPRPTRVVGGAETL